MPWLTLFFHWAFTIVGAGVLVLTTFDVWRGWRARRWPAVIGKITECSAHHERGGHGGGYLADVVYQYDLNGATLTGSRVTYGWRRMYRTERGAIHSLRGMLPGDSVRVFYSPRRPSEAVLRLGPSLADVFALLVGAGLLFGGLQLK